MTDRTNEFLTLCQSLPTSDLTSSSAPDGSKMSSSSGAMSSSSSSNNNNTNNRRSMENHREDLAQSTAVSQLKSFHGMAADISKDIATTSSYLSELTRLVKQRSGSLMEDDENHNRVHWLVLRIKENMQHLHLRLEECDYELQRTKRKWNKQASQEATNVVGQLQQDLVNASTDFKKVLQVRSEKMKQVNERKSSLLFGNNNNNNSNNNNEESMEMASLLHKPKLYGEQEDTNNNNNNNNNEMERVPEMSSFLNSDNRNSSPTKSPGMPMLDLSSVVKLRQQNQHKKKHEQYGGESSGALPRPYYDDRNNHQFSNDYGLSLSGSSGGLRSRNITSAQTHNNQKNNYLPVYTPAQLAKLEEGTAQQQAMQLIPDQAYLRQRAEAMSQVESNIAELGTVFNKLATMVQEHKELVQRVEDNVEDAHSNVMLSMETLNQTLYNLRTNKALFLKVLSVIIVFVILFITFFA